MTARRQRIIGALGAVLVTGLCLAVAASSGALDAAVRTLALANASVWAVVLILMVTISGLRFLRLQAAIDGARPLDTFNGAALHGSAAALLPGKLGELVLPIVVRRLTGSTILAGAGLLVFFRALDLATLFALAAFAGILVGGPPLLLAPLSAAALFAPFVLQKLASLSIGRQGRLWRFLAGAADIAGRFTIARMAAIFALTASVWILLWGAAFVAARGAGIEAAPPAVAGLAVAASSAAFASPVNGVANAGPFEAAFAGVYAAFGHAAAPALAAAVLLHICAIIAPLLCLAAGEAAALALRLRLQLRELR